MKYFDDKTFENKDYTESPLEEGEYESCTFKNCNFLAVDLSKNRFLGSHFINCNLSNAKIHKASFQDVQFANCKMLGLSFDDCNAFNFSIHLEQCMLNHSVFYQVDLRKTTFKRCQLHEVDFTKANLDSVVFNQCDLASATFEGTHLQQTDFRNASNYSIDPEINNIKGARFSVPEVLRLLEKYDIDVEFN